MKTRANAWENTASSRQVGLPNLSISAKLSLSCAVSLGKSSSVSLAFPAAIFFSSSPAAPRLRAATQAAAASDTPHDFMETQRGLGEPETPTKLKKK